jgi:hypothetical protein
MGGDGFVPFQNRLNLLGPPHCSELLPVHAMLQSVAVARDDPDARYLPQSAEKSFCIS